MTTQTMVSAPVATRGTISVRKVKITAPLSWLASGWKAFRRAPGASLLYGGMFSLACVSVMWLTTAFTGFTVAFITSLLLAGPFLAAGLYVGARQQHDGAPTSIRDALSVVFERRSNLGLYTVLLALIMVAWARVSALLFAIKFNTINPSVEAYLALFSGPTDIVILSYFFGIGLLLALVVFVTSAIAIPMIVDRDAEPLRAMQISARAVAANWKPMILWAAIIVALTAFGIATMFAAMLVLFPILGYAAWHSYNEIVN